MSGEMTRVGSLPFCIVSFQAFDGSKGPYGIIAGNISSLNSSRTCVCMCAKKINHWLRVICSCLQIVTSWHIPTVYMYKISYPFLRYIQLYTQSVQEFLAEYSLPLASFPDPTLKRWEVGPGNEASLPPFVREKVWLHFLSIFQFLASSVFLFLHWLQLYHSAFREWGGGWYVPFICTLSTTPVHWPFIDAGLLPTKVLTHSMTLTTLLRVKQGSHSGPVWTRVASLSFKNVAFGYQGTTG